MTPELKVNNQQLTLDPFCGGAIKELTLSSNGITKTLISPKEGYHYQSSLLFPFPNRLQDGKFEFEGNTYQFPLNDFGLPNALHGMLHDKPFELKSETENELSLGYNYDGDLSYYPFPFKIDLSYKLAPGSLSVEVKIVNTGNTTLPCAFGWHPYFNLPEKGELGKLQLMNVGLVEVDEAMIPTGKSTPYRTLEEPNDISALTLDTCFRAIEKEDRYVTRLIYPDKSVLEVWQDENHPFTQMYTPEDRRTIAIEPMTGNINALNTKDGLSLIEPKQSLTLNFGVSLQ